ncbi:helix-turn-helix domain-containing protein [Chitinophaga sancti]|uniref:AraC-type DNA-binding protein n=1 Tax=Chitinophaga sancti TaxID=1004 RepID=A0A1K1MXS3_9BACT|nr:helix-turn-helix transcriptional regulator [Chitinophaga sancti]WQD63074.1 helix-turn-helix domain-containing protein [Chitinophaga sancti]WQG91301.1 helix-turn-helix domain-containing protein [Chitinophaga sancti]SFW27797.1 AraC-type DNA-binding protein [Chitinophaga sancti]
MPNGTPLSVKSITQLHRVLDLPAPKHPLISVVDYAKIEAPAGVAAVFDLYSISLKKGVNKLIYGQQQYDFDEGVLYFLAPNQVLSVEDDAAPDRSGWILFVHPDFLWNTPLAKKIKQYEFFNYSVNEALFLSESEEAMLNGIVQYIQQEYHANIDKFSQDVVIAQLDLLLTYARRFYERQFITRKITNHKVLERLEALLNDYFEQEKGLPAVQYVAAQLNISVKYLSSLVKQLTGQTTQQHIQNKLIEKAKEKLSTTDLSVSEIAFYLGFEHSQSFNKLFKKKTNLSPLEFRKLFN